MMQRIIITCALLCAGMVATFATPVAAAKLTAADCVAKGKVLTFKPWYANVVEVKSDKCEIKSPGDTVSEQQKFIWGIVLVIVEDIFQLAAYVAVGFIMYGGFLYLTSTGSPEYTKQAMRTIINAVIGMVVAIASIAIVGFIGGRI